MSMTDDKQSTEILDKEDEFNLGHMVMSTDLSSVEGDVGVTHIFSTLGYQG
jgi:hypothetical protein